MGFHKDDCILLPEYICDVILHPINQLGLKYRYYSVDDSFSPRWDELEKLINHKTKAIIMVHYFGQPQDIEKYKLFCNEHNLVLIEDNAHGHGGYYAKKLLGTYGDIGISSPRKVANLYSGGILYLNNNNNNNLKIESRLLPCPISIENHLKRLLSNLSPSLKGYLKKKLSSRPHYEDPKAFRENEIVDYEIDKRSKNYINKVDWDILRSRRQKQYYKWNDFANKNNLVPVIDNLYPDANPWCFPAYTKDQYNAIDWFDWGWKNNKNVFSWPSLPDEVLKKEGESINRWKRLICFGL